MNLNWSKHYLCSVFIRFSIIKGVTNKNRVIQKQKEFYKLYFRLFCPGFHPKVTLHF